MIVEIVETVRFKNKLGVHARTGTQLVRIASKFESEILIKHEGTCVNAKSVLDVMTLVVPTESEVTIIAKGSDAEQAISELVKLIKSKFGEP
jgi:phosphocarrier protein